MRNVHMQDKRDAESAFSEGFVAHTRVLFTNVDLCKQKINNISRSTRFYRQNLNKRVIFQTQFSSFCVVSFIVVPELKQTAEIVY